MWINRLFSLLRFCYFELILMICQIRFSNECCGYLKKKSFKFLGGKLTYKGWDSQYFCTFLVPNKSLWNAIFLQTFWSTLILLLPSSTLLNTDLISRTNLLFDKKYIYINVLHKKRNCNFICFTVGWNRKRKYNLGNPYCLPPRLRSTF